MLAEELKQKESELKSEMSSRRKEILKDKRLVLFDRLIKDSGHLDKALVQDLAAGFSLTGELPKSHEPFESGRNFM